MGWTAQCGRMEWAESIAALGLHALLAGHDARKHQPIGRGCLRPCNGAWICIVVRLLVHGFSCYPDGDGGKDGRVCAARAVDCGVAEDVFSVPRYSAWSDRDFG